MHKMMSLTLRITFSSWFQKKNGKKKVTFSDEETSVVEIEDDSYGSGDCSPGHSGAGQSHDDGEPANESEGDNVSNSSNLNIEKAEARNKKLYLQLSQFCNC